MRGWIIFAKAREPAIAGCHSGAENRICRGLTPMKADEDTLGADETITRWKVLLEIAASVENARYLDEVVPTTVEEKMGGNFCAAHSAAAQRDLVGPCTFHHEFGTLLRARTLMVGFDIN